MCLIGKESILEKVKKYKTFFSIKFRNHEDNTCIKSQETTCIEDFLHTKVFHTLEDMANQAILVQAQI